MKKIIFVLVMSPFLAFANANQNQEQLERDEPVKIKVETVELALNLSVFQVCNTPICSVENEIAFPRKITLQPQNGVCQDESPESCMSWAYTGHWSDVKMISDQRYISIVTVDRYFLGMDTGNGRSEYRYSITAEIISDEGIEAKVVLNDIKDINDLNSITLVTNEKESWGYKYFATLFVGDKNDGLIIGAPCEGNDCLEPTPRQQNSLDPSLNTNLILEKGFLR